MRCSHHSPQSSPCVEDVDPMPMLQVLHYCAAQHVVHQQLSILYALPPVRWGGTEKLKGEMGGNAETAKATQECQRHPKVTAFSSEPPSRVSALISEVAWTVHPAPASPCPYLPTTRPNI